MDLLLWIEETALADWVRVSAFGYPIMITLHSIGLAIMVGLSVALAFRLLGWFQTVPYVSLHKFLKVAWIGFIVNFVSGSALFSSQAASYVTNMQFLLKMGLVVLGAISVAVLQTLVQRDSDAWGAARPPLGVRLLAIGSIAAWIGATVTGRLIAYL